MKTEVHAPGFHAFAQQTLFWGAQDDLSLVACNLVKGIAVYKLYSNELWAYNSSGVFHDFYDFVHVCNAAYG